MEAKNEHGKSPNKLAKSAESRTSNERAEREWEISNRQ